MQRSYKQFTRILAIEAVCVATMLPTGCGMDDVRGDIDDLKGRVERLETLTAELDRKITDNDMITKVEPLAAPKSGWLISFLNGTPIEVLNGVKGDNGEKGQKGETPLIEVKTVDGVAALWIDGVQKCVLTGAKGDKGDKGVAPKIEVRPGSDGEGFYIWYNITANYPDEGWVDTGVDIAAALSPNPLSNIIRNEANGTVTLVLNDPPAFTEYVFAMRSTAQSFEILSRKTVEFSGSESREIYFRVNPSGAWVPTGEGNAVRQWAIDMVSTTRASYVTPTEVFSIESVSADGDKKGQYIAKVKSNAAGHDLSVEEYTVMLVLNNDRENPAADDALISSSPFGMKVSIPEVDFVTGYSEYFGGGNFMLSMFTMETDEYGYPMGNGSYMTLQLFSQEPSGQTPEDIVHPKIASGNYTVGDSGDIFTIVPGKTEDEGYAPSGVIKVVDFENFGFELLAIRGGILKVDNGDGGNCVLAFDFMLSDGSRYKGRYEGPVGLINRTISTSLTEDVAMEPLTKGNADTHSYGNTRTYDIELTSAGVNMDQGTGSGDRVKFELYSSNEGDGSIIPAGVYTVDNSGDAGTIYRGEMVNTNLWGSWYRRIEDGEIRHDRQGPLHTGRVTVEYADGIYTMEFDVTDDIGNKITGRFEGAITLR